MQEKMIERLTAWTLEDSIKGRNTLKLGTKSRKNVLNVTKYIKPIKGKDGKTEEVIRNNSISFADGYSIATDGCYVFVNWSDYSKLLYERSMVNYMSGEHLDRMVPSYSQIVSVIQETASTHFIEVEDLLEVIDQQLERYAEAKANDPSLEWDMEHNMTNHLYCTGYDDLSFMLDVTKSKKIKDYIGLCKSHGDCAIGVAPFQGGVLKIVGEGMMLLVNGGYFYSFATETGTDITNIIKPINK